MKYIISKDGGKQHIQQIFNVLSQIEVKGDSVEYLYNAKLMVKELFDTLEEYKEKPKEQQEEKEE